MEELNTADYFAIFRRWQKVFYAVTGILLLLALVVAFRWSNYRSIAVIQVDDAQISSTATTPLGVNPQDAVQALADKRISALQQKILSTASMVEIITKFNLYPSAREDNPIADIAETMRKKIHIDLISSALANPSVARKEQLSAIAFTLSFDYPDPLLAQQVTDELATRFLDEDLKQRRTEAEETSSFLGQQIAEMETSLSEQEKKIADFRKEHGISRPENLAFNQQAAVSLTLNLQTLQSQIATNEGLLGSLRGQLAAVDPYVRVVGEGQVLTSPSIQLKALQSQYASLSAQYGSEHPDVVKVRRQMSALQVQVGAKKSRISAQIQAQIEDTKTNLAAAEKTYGLEHPDVIALKSQLKKLEDQRAAQKDALGFGGQIVEDADNPAYLQVASQLNAAEEQHKALLEQRDKIQAQQHSFQQAIIANPEAEQELAALSRDYENAQLRYRELKERKMSADMDKQMQKDRKGQRLTLINPPELPDSTQPKRILLILAGIFASVCGGLGAVIAVQILKQGLVGLHQVESVVGVAPLVAIPHIRTREEFETSMARRIERHAYTFWDFTCENMQKERLGANWQKLRGVLAKLNDMRIERFGKKG